MGEQRFKVGDWVRRVEPSDWPEQYGVVDGTYKVLQVGRYGIAITAGAGEADATSFEPWKPRVGERVLVTYPGWEGDGEVTADYEHGITLVTLKSGKSSGDEGGFFLRDLEPILSTSTPVLPATLKIEAGKFYKTRDGRKVGPMSRWSQTAEHPWEQQGGSSVFTNGGDIWRDDGTSEYDVPPLIAEWIDEPVVKAEASNDNAQPNFKVGDRVKLARSFYGAAKVGATATIGQRVMFGGFVDVVWDKNHLYQGQMNGGYSPDYFELIPSTPSDHTSIVALIENGQPKPSSTPHVHASTGAAEKEAKRLAAKYKGKQFGVFTLTTTHEEAAPVYDHKWQNMAALGLKIDAIKELRAVAGLTLKGAKDAVEAWIEYENAA